jgi:hypothetical protein
MSQPAVLERRANWGRPHAIKSSAGTAIGPFVHFGDIFFFPLPFLTTHGVDIDQELAAQASSPQPRRTACVAIFDTETGLSDLHRLLSHGFKPPSFCVHGWCRRGGELDLNLVVDPRTSR